MALDADESPFQRFERRYRRYRAVYELQEGRCFYCGQTMTLPDAEAGNRPLARDRVTIEHLVTIPNRRRLKRLSRLYPHILDQPLPQLNTRDNIVAACHACNNERGGRIGWRTFLARKIVQHWSPK